MKQHYVEFLSPGTLFHEIRAVPIHKWDVDTAIEMSRGIKERHGAVPFGFQFVTRGRQPDELDAKELKRSGTYFLGGVIETRDEVTARNDPDEIILRSNMRDNDINRIVTNTNSWKVVQPFKEGDTLLNLAPPGIDADHG